MKNRNVFQKTVITLLAAFIWSMSAPTVHPQTLRAPKQEKLLNGLKILMWNDAHADKVSVKLRIHSGSAFDPQGKEGVMSMLAEGIFPNEASREFFAEDLGGDLKIETNYDYIQINASSRPDALLTVLETLSTAVGNPTIDKETTAKLRNTLLTKVLALESDPAYVADRAAAKRLFGTFPYGRPVYGNEASLKLIEFPDLLDARQRFLAADNATMVIAGNFDRSLAFRAVRRYFGSWLKADKKVPLTFRQPDAPLGDVFDADSPKQDTSMILISMRGTARSDRDLAASMIYSAILQQRLRSRVPSVHAAEVFVRNDAYALPGMITIGFTGFRSLTRSSSDKVEAKEMFAKAISDPISEGEFQASKSLFQAEWSKKDPYTFWLDADTYKIASPEHDTRIGDAVTLTDVLAFADKAR
ncbi:MAG: pitrilysin family protein, partial [Pyrinomonadaceae bacterium]